MEPWNTWGERVVALSRKSQKKAAVKPLLRELDESGDDPGWYMLILCGLFTWIAHLLLQLDGNKHLFIAYTQKFNQFMPLNCCSTCFPPDGRQRVEYGSVVTLIPVGVA